MTPWPRPLRIVVTGPESTGKTTLAQGLAERLGTLWVPEYSRLYAARHRRPLTAADVEPIAHGHLSQEEEALARLASTLPEPGRAPLVLDTDLASTVVYARHYYGRCPSWILTAALERRGDLYLLADIDIAWEPDGIRDRPTAREAMLALFGEQLAELGAPTRRISGLGPARLATALAAVREALPGLR